MGELRQMDKSGDTKLMWSAENADEVASAKRTFDELKKKNFLAYSVKKRGGMGEQIREFDPSAEKIIMAPPMAGG